MAMPAYKVVKKGFESIFLYSEKYDRDINLKKNVTLEATYITNITYIYLNSQQYI